MHHEKVEAQYLSPEALRSIRKLYESGLYLQAYHRAKTYGEFPSESWQATPGRILAGRMAWNLGAPRLGRALHFYAWRTDRQNPEATYYYARLVFDFRGPLAAWEFLSEQGELVNADQSTRADWYAYHAVVLGCFRDFDAADTWLKKAEQISPDNAWIWIERAHLLELQDRYEEALESAKHALELQPWYRPGVQAVAHGLMLTGKDEQALSLLMEASERIESATIVGQLVVLQNEVGHYEAALKSIDRFEELSPLIEKSMRKWLMGMRSDCLCMLGDLERSRQWGLENGSEFHKKAAENLAKAAPDAPYKLLPVSFVRQHHMTCAPATLVAISAYWNLKADHLEVSAKICYDGTPAHSERSWAEENGWVTREFTLSWQSAVELIDRGIPSTLTTVQPTSAHLQALVGYDARRRTLLIRDPYERYLVEFMADDLFELQKLTGPRGLALVPKDKAHLLDALNLPDAELYDRYYRMQCLLQDHQAEQAGSIFETMEEDAPDHYLTFQARCSWASYHGNRSELLSAYDRMLKFFPGHDRLKLGRLACLRELGRRQDRLEMLEKEGEAKKAHPIFIQEYARELRNDARSWPRAIRAARRAIRQQPLEPTGYHLLASILWDQRFREKALMLFRFAACLDDKNEQLATSFFMATRHFRRTDDVLAYLKGRASRFGRLSSMPVRSWFWALNQVNRTREAFEALETAQEWRPEDGDLMLFAVDAYARFGRFDKADELLLRAKQHSSNTAWLRMAAELAGYRGDLNQALNLWEQVLEKEPLAMDAHRAVAQLLAETETIERALERLAESAKRFPKHYALHQLWIEWLGEESPEQTVPVIEDLLSTHPADGWGLRERALRLGQVGRFEEAFESIEEARQLEPTHPASYSIRGQLFAYTNQCAEARAAFKEALRLEIDSDYSQSQLVGLCTTVQMRREALGFILHELVRQVGFGDGLMAYRRLASETLNDEELLATLREALAARPDLWQAWTALVRQLTDMNRVEEALDLSRQALDRFPLVPQLWLDQALISRYRHEPEKELEALNTTLQISPAWGAAVRELAEFHQRNHNFEQARVELEKAIASAPLDPFNHGCLADVLWKQGRQEEALERLKKAVHLEPGYQWAWGTLVEWSSKLERMGEPEDLARELIRKRPKESRSWLTLARVLQGDDRTDERLKAIDKAIELNKRSIDAYDLKAIILFQKGEVEQAESICRTNLMGHQPPLALRGRMAWIAAQRGDFQEAISRIRNVVKEDPKYYAGWSQLADWQLAVQDLDGYLDAAQNMYRLDPQNPVNIAYLGDAKLKTGSPAEAKDAFRAAMRLSPDYSFASFSLFDQQLKDNELDEAEATLQHIIAYVPGPYALSREVQLCAIRKQKNRAFEAFAQLCEDPVEDHWPLANAEQALENHWEAESCEALKKALEGTQPHPMVSRLLVEALCKQRRWAECENVLMQLGDERSQWEQSALVYLNQLAEGPFPKPLRRFIERQKDRLKANDRTWGVVSYALSRLEDWRAIRAWMGDWKNRKAIEPWMLFNLMLALRDTGEDDAAYEVGTFALELPPDHSSGEHQVWLAFEQAHRNEVERARENLKALRRAELTEYYQFVYDLTRARIAAQGDEVRYMSEVYENLSRAKQVVPGYARDKALARAYRRCVWSIAQRRNSAMGFAWGVIQYISSLL